MCLVNIVYARVLWNPLPIILKRGVDDIAFTVYYETICEEDRVIYNHPLMKRSGNTTSEFDTWCRTFAIKTIRQGIDSFCKSQEVLPPDKVIPWVVVETGETTSTTKKPGTLPGKSGSLGPTVGRRRVKTRKGYAFKRVRRDLGLTIVLGVAIVGLGYTLYRYLTSSTNPTGVELAASIDQLKTVAASQDELTKQVQLLARGLNITMNNQEHILETLQRLQMTTSIENIATISQVVTSYGNVAQDLRVIAQDWHKGKIHQSFPSTFAYVDPCLHHDCPLEHHEPSSCLHQPTAQTVTFRFKRIRVQPGMELIEANPFTYYHLKSEKDRDNLGKVNQTTVVTCSC